MITIEALNVNYALHYGEQMLTVQGHLRDSRNGPVLIAPEPVTTLYENPCERVMLHPGRDANPFFHLVEALWMLAGRNDLKVLTPYVRNMINFSDDGGKTQPGAYGYRWRDWFRRFDMELERPVVLDQIKWAIRRLRDDPNDRRVVIQMYDAEVDQYKADNGGKDIPCNLIALPSVGIDGRLNLTVYNRSNDMVWGAYGANAVHFSVLQEYLAAQIGVPVGRYWQVSNNFHAYLNTLNKAGNEWPWGYMNEFNPDPYSSGQVRPYPMFSWDGSRYTDEELLDDLQMFFESPSRVGIRSPFLRHTACPMVMAHRAFKQEGIKAAREVLQQMDQDSDWRAGAELWLDNRETRQRKAADDGVNYEA